MREAADECSWLLRFLAGACLEGFGLISSIGKPVKSSSKTTRSVAVEELAIWR